MFSHFVDPPSSELTDNLVDRAKEGDEESYNRLFKRLEKRLLFYIRFKLGRKLRDSFEETDILQEAYLQAHKSFSSFEKQGEGSFTKWIYRIVEHRIRDLAKQSSAKKRQAPTPVLRGTDVFRDARAENTSPSRACLRDEQKERLLTALEELPSKEQEAILSRYFKELSLDAIAGELGMSEVGVRRMLMRARLSLGRKLRIKEA